MNFPTLRESFVKRYTQTMAFSLLDELDKMPIREGKTWLLMKVMNDLIDDHAQGCVFAQLADSLEKTSRDIVDTTTRPIIIKLEGK